jgi:tetratricopeptide (TPR) repeat protein
MTVDARRELVGFLETHPDHAQARVLLAGLALQEQEVREAVRQLDRVQEPRQRGFGYWRNRTVALERLGRYEEALVALEEAECLRPGAAELALLRGVLRLRLWDAEGAERAFGQYRLRLGEQSAPPLYYASAILSAAMVGDLEKAAYHGKEGLSHYPDCGPILVNAGAVLLRAGDAERASACFLRATKGTPPLPQAHKNLGNMALERGDVASARAHFERAIKLDPELGDDVYLKLGDIAYRESDPGFAQLLWRRALELNPENKVVRTNLESLATAGTQ